MLLHRAMCRGKTPRGHGGGVGDRWSSAGASTRSAGLQGRARRGDFQGRDGRIEELGVGGEGAKYNWEWREASNKENSLT